MSNPCLSCGACCAFFRASFHWLETAAAYGLPPLPPPAGTTRAFYSDVAVRMQNSVGEATEYHAE